MLLCNFCDMRNCDYMPYEDGCEWNTGCGDEEAVIKYAQDHGISVSDAVALIKFCCGLK